MWRHPLRRSSLALSCDNSRWSRPGDMSQKCSLPWQAEREQRKGYTEGGGVNSSRRTTCRTCGGGHVSTRCACPPSSCWRKRLFTVESNPLSLSCKPLKLCSIPLQSFWGFTVHAAGCEIMALDTSDNNLRVFKISSTHSLCHSTGVGADKPPAAEALALLLYIPAGFPGGLSEPPCDQCSGNRRNITRFFFSFQWISQCPSSWFPSAADLLAPVWRPTSALNSSSAPCCVRLWDCFSFLLRVHRLAPAGFSASRFCVSASGSRGAFEDAVFLQICPRVWLCRSSVLEWQLLMRCRIMSWEIYCKYERQTGESPAPVSSWW